MKNLITIGLPSKGRLKDKSMEFFNNKNFKKTGLTAIFTASLELTKDGIIDLNQENLFTDIYIRTAKHTPMKLKKNN